MKNPHRRNSFFYWIALWVIIFSIAAAPGPQIYQDNGWSSPVSISSSQVTGWFPDIVSDSTGRIHVAWAAGTTGYDTVLYTSSTDGVTWSKTNDIAAVPRNGTDSVATRPALWVDASGYLDLSYVGGSLFFSRAPSDSAASATAWSQPVKANSDQVPYFSRLLEDSQHQLHIFYTENVISINCAQCYHLFHRVSNDNGLTWSDPQDISADGTGVAKPQVIANDQGGIFVVWESGDGGGLGQLSGPSVVKFTASYDFGKTWTPSTVLSPSSVKEARDITIGLDGNGNLITAWLALPDNTVDYQVSYNYGKSWSDPETIAGITGSYNVYPSKLDDYSMVTDSAGNVHLLLIGQLESKATPTPTLAKATQTPEPSSLSVLHLAWQGSSWSTPDAVTTLNGDVPEWPRAAISDGNVLNVVWFVRDQANIWNSDNAHYRIWYARKELGTPPLPTVIPTFTVQTTPIGQVSLVPTAAPTLQAGNALPTLSPAEKDQSQATIYSESDYLGIFAKSLAPTALVILVVGLIVFFLRGRQ